MVTAMIFDTLKLAEELETEAGFDAARARAMARILAGSTGGNLATREDILIAKGELHEDMQGLRDEIHGIKTVLEADFQRVDAGLKGEMQDLRGQIQEVRGDVRVLYWISGTTLTGVAALLSIAIAVALQVMHLN